MPGVQIIGKEAIIDTFNDCKAETFALFQGQNLIIAGTGADELALWIDRFCPPGISGSFTLRLYDCDSASVRKGSDYTGSFNCRIMDGYSMGGFSSVHTKRIEALEKKVNGEGEGEDKLTDALMGWLEEPEKLVQVIGAVRGLLGMGAPLQPEQAAIGAVTPKIISPGELTQTEEQRYRKLCLALDRLEKKDPRIVEHLEQLAGIAEKKPDTFNMMIGMLKDM